MIKYSIIIPVRNALEYAKDCIQSVLMQDYNNYEIIVSDNHSTDSVAKYVQSLKNPSIRLIKPESSLGMVDHFEFALSQAQGEWIIFLGADDGLQPYFFDLCNMLIEQAQKMGLRVINGPRAYFFWDGCEGIYGDIKISYAARSCFYKKNAKVSLLNSLIGIKEYFDLPQMYTTSVVHRSVVDKVKEQQGGKFYTSLTPDANGAANICTLETHYMESLIPLGWVGTSPKSNGFQYSASDSQGGDILKSNLLSTHISWHPLMGRLQSDGAVKILSITSSYLYESLLQAHRMQGRAEEALYSSNIFKLVLFARMQAKMRSKGIFVGEQKEIFYDILKRNGLSRGAVKVIGVPLARICSLVFKLEDVFCRLIQFGIPAMHHSLHMPIPTGYSLVDASKCIRQKNGEERFFVQGGPMPQRIYGWQRVVMAVFHAFRFSSRKIVKKISVVEKWEIKDKKHLYYTRDYGRTLDAPLIDSFYEVIDAPNFEEKLATLQRGLDTVSRATVLRIVERIKCTRGMKSYYYDFFSREEKKFLNYQQFNFQGEVTKINDTCYEISGFKFPINIGPVTFYYRYFTNEIENIENINEKAVIDVGAYVGDSAVLFSQLTKGKVYCFEPVKDNYNKLLKTIEMNALANVLPVHKGLGAKKETLFIDVDDSASSYMRKTAPGMEATEVTTLDSFVTESNIDRVGLIKVDIEGFEQYFLQGAINTIRRDKPVLLLSIYHRGTDFFDIKPFLESMDLGYKFKIRQQFCGAIFTETLLIAEVR